MVPFLKRLNKSFSYAIEGITYATVHNHTLQTQLVIAVVVLAAAFFFKITAAELAIVWLLIIFVLMAEMVNTSIEQMTDLIVKEHRMEAKIAKDVGAGMVFITALGACIAGIVIFGPYLLKFFGL